MTEPLVSIVIATYNHGLYLPELIESVLSQTYKNIEVIVIDDGSTDDTQTIVRQYPVKYVYQTNHGASNAFNVGIKMSHGQFYVTPGADDRLHPKYIELCLEEMLKDNRIGFIWTAAKEFGISKEIRIPLPLRSRFSIYRGSGGQLGAALFRRKAYDDVIGYDETLSYYEDWDLAIRMIKCGWKGRPVFKPIYFWRRHEISRNTQAGAVLQSVLESKYPQMKLYSRLARIEDFLALLPYNPKKSIRGLSKKLIKR